MKRNWDVIRCILARLESLDNSWQALQHPDFECGTADEVSYHMELLFEAGLVEGEMNKTSGPGPYGFLAYRLTWYGHEFLDAVDSDQVWEETKTSFRKAGISMTFDMVRSVAMRLGGKILDASLGA